MSICFIRRYGRPWERARSHHEQAYLAFLTYHEEMETVDLPEPLAAVIAARRIEPPRYRIVVPHVDGGDFVAYFDHVGEEVSHYLDEYGNLVQIMFAEPGYAAFVNRLTQY